MSGGAAQESTVRMTPAATNDAAPGLAGLGAAGVQNGGKTHMNDTILREPKLVPIRCSECHCTRANVGDEGVCCEPVEANVQRRNAAVRGAVVKHDGENVRAVDFR